MTTTEWNPTENPDREAQLEFFQWAHQRPPAWSDLLQAWVIARADDVETVANDPKTYSSTAAVPLLDSALPADVQAILREAGSLGTNVVQADPPLHAELRAIAEEVLHGRRINRWIPYMAAVAHDLLDRVGEGTLDVVSEFAAPFVRRVLARIVGVPDDDRVRLEEGNDAMLAVMAPSTEHATKLVMARRVVEYDRYVDELIARRRAEPADDLATALVEAYDRRGAGDEALPDMRMFIRGVYAGGIHTTTDAIAAVVWTMLTVDNGAPWREAVARPRQLSGIVEEVLRRDAPHRGLLRVATRDTTLSGTRIAAGEQVMLLFGAANHDPHRYDQPDNFRPDRPGVRDHFAFGHGIHRCVGRALARHEIREALTALTQRRPHATLAADWTPSWQPTFYFHGLRDLPVE